MHYEKRNNVCDQMNGLDRMRESLVMSCCSESISTSGATPDSQSSIVWFLMFSSLMAFGKVLITRAACAYSGVVFRNDFYERTADSITIGKTVGRETETASNNAVE